MPLDAIIVRGAREHNLKNVDVTIPRDKLVVITGPIRLRQELAGLRHDLRRGAAPLCRVALGLRPPVPRPDGEAGRRLHRGPLAGDLDRPEGASRNPRSTVGTVTEIYDYLRLLFARAGKPHCPNCGRPIEQQTVQQIVDSILALPAGKRIMLLAPVIQDRKGEHQGVFEDARTGRLRARARRRRGARPRRHDHARPLQEPLDRGRRRPPDHRGAASRAHKRGRGGGRGFDRIVRQPPRRLGRDGAEAR